MKALLDEVPGMEAYLDGTIASLMRSMDEAGIEKSVVCCIATKIEQFERILSWCREIRSDRLIPFPSVHPADPNMAKRIEQIASEGFLGVKLHPFYQDFYAADSRMRPLYERVAWHNLILVMHTGFDIAFPRQRRADPQTLLKLTERFPGLRLVATHLGAWQQWEEVQHCLIGRPIYIEMSLATDYLEAAVLREMLMAHPQEYLLFGTDCPWSDQRATLSRLKALDLPDQRLSHLVFRNAADLLGRTDPTIRRH